MEKKSTLHRYCLATREKSTRVMFYPAVADSVDLPEFLFRKNKDEDAFVVLTPVEQQSLLKNNAAISSSVMTLDDLRLKTLLAPMWPEIAGLNITFNIIGRRAPLLTIDHDGMNMMVEAHWNLFVPYYNQIKALPIVHPEILDIFADAAFRFVALAIQHPKATKNELRGIVIDAYRARPELLLASLDIVNKPNIYHIRPTRIWLNGLSAANDRYRLQIDDSAAAAAPLVGPEFLEEVASFIHKVVKNYAFRYVDYLWTQRYKITFGARSGVEMVAFEGKDIVVNIHPLIYQSEWKPAVYFSLGYAVILAIIQSSGKDDKRENTFLAMKKTWNRYLSYDDSAEQRSVRELCSSPQSDKDEEQCRNLLQCTIGERCRELIDDFIMLSNYSSKETFEERLEVLNQSQDGKRTGLYFEQLSSAIRNINASLIRNNINYSKLIEILRNDNVDHHQLAEFLCTGRLGNMDVVDVREWLLLRTLLYDLINAPRVFRNDYKMLLKVLTKVNKSLIIYVWALGIENDPRYETVSAYIAKLMNDIFVFNRVKIYEIVADPVECLEAEAVTGYLLNWAGLTLEKRRSIMAGALLSLPRHVVSHLSVQTPGDVDQLVPAIRTGTSGLIGFYLYQAYRWGSTQDELTERIRSYFPELLKQAQNAMLPSKTIMGGAMLLLLLAQIISDERDGFAGHIAITDEQRQIVRDLIKQCIDWDQRHFVMMVAGIAAGYMGNIDGWTLQQFDTLLGRYGGGDRVVLRSVVQFDVENLLERTLISARDGEELAVVNKIQLLRFGVDSVVSDQANKFLRTMASRHGLQSPEVILKRKDIHELVLDLSQRMKAQTMCHDY